MIIFAHPPPPHHSCRPLIGWNWEKESFAGGTLPTFHGGVGCHQSPLLPNLQWISKAASDMRLVMVPEVKALSIFWFYGFLIRGLVEEIWIIRTSVISDRHLLLSRTPTFGWYNQGRPGTGAVCPYKLATEWPQTLRYTMWRGLHLQDWIRTTSNSRGE